LHDITKMTAMGVPTSAWEEPAQGLHQNETYTLQKYMVLQAQHEALRQNVEQLRSPGLTASPLGSPTNSTYPFAETSPYSSRSSSVSRSHSRGRRASAQSPPGALPCVLETVLDEATLAELAAEEAKLADVNEGIKRALTELLNCGVVRGDRAWRGWVQQRLMDTEKELRVGRRRRSAPGYE
jgi:hypothetical protein